MARMSFKQLEIEANLRGVHVEKISNTDYRVWVHDHTIAQCGTVQEAYVEVCDMAAQAKADKK